MATKSSIVKTRVFKIICYHSWGSATTRVYQSKKTYERAWKRPFYYYEGNRYEGYELRHGRWVHIGTQTSHLDADGMHLTLKGKHDKI